MTKEEKAAYNRVYNEANKEKISARNKAYYEVNREKVLAQKATHYQANREKMLARKATYYEANKEKVIARAIKYQKANPEKRKAHDAVRTAVRNGSLVRLPCSECGETNTEAHHYAYDMPLDVIWLCSMHHKQLHKEHREYEQLSQ